MTQSLDLSPDEFRRVSAQLSDMLAQYLADLPERKVYPGRHPEVLRKSFDEALPERGFGLDRLLDALRNRVLPDSMGTSMSENASFFEAEGTKPSRGTT